MDVSHKVGIYQINHKKHTRVISTLDGAVLGARHSIGAEGGVPSVASVAVGVAADVVSPAPVGVKNHSTVLSRAASATSTSAGLPCQLGMSLSRRRSDLLSAGGSNEGYRGEGECPVHLDCW